MCAQLLQREKKEKIKFDDNLNYILKNNLPVNEIKGFTNYLNGIESKNKNTNDFYERVFGCLNISKEGIYSVRNEELLNHIVQERVEKYAQVKSKTGKTLATVGIITDKVTEQYNGPSIEAIEKKYAKTVPIKTKEQKPIQEESKIYSKGVSIKDGETTYHLVFKEKEDRLAFDQKFEELMSSKYASNNIRLAAVKNFLAEQINTAGDLYVTSSDPNVVKSFQKMSSAERQRYSETQNKNEITAELSRTSLKYVKLHEKKENKKV